MLHMKSRLDEQFGLQAEHQEWILEQKATKKATKPKSPKKPKKPKSQKVIDWNICSKECLMPKVHTYRDAMPYSSPRQPPANSAIVQRLQAAQPKTKLRKKS